MRRKSLSVTTSSTKRAGSASISRLRIHNDDPQDKSEENYTEGVRALARDAPSGPHLIQYASGNQYYCDPCNDDADECRNELSRSPLPAKELRSHDCDDGNEETEYRTQRRLIAIAGSHISLLELSSEKCMQYFDHLLFGLENTQEIHLQGYRSWPRRTVAGDSKTAI